MVVARYPVPPVIRAADIVAKVGLVGLLVFALLFPDASHMREKAAGLRAVVYPALAFTVPAIWLLHWRERASFPWLADLLVTVTCFSDILGNGMDLYDTVVWFDDWMHLMNTGAARRGGRPADHAPLLIPGPGPRTGVGGRGDRGHRVGDR